MRKERWHTDPGPDPARPSKSQVKRDLQALQDFALELAGVPSARLDGVGMDESLREALVELRRLNNNNAQRRQARYVGKLLEDIDLEPFRQALAAGNLQRR